MMVLTGVTVDMCEYTAGTEQVGLKVAMILMASGLVMVVDIVSALVTTAMWLL